MSFGMAKRRFRVPSAPRNSLLGPGITSQTAKAGRTLVTDNATTRLTYAPKSLVDFANAAGTERRTSDSFCEVLPLCACRHPLRLNSDARADPTGPCQG